MPERRRARGSIPRSALALALVLLIGAGVGAALAVGRTRGTASRQELRAPAQWQSGARKTPGFSLPDQAGRTISPAAVRGRVALLTFLDSRCRGMCPLEARELTAAVARLPAGSRPVLLVVSVDPWKDTPRTERSFAARARWTMPWHWLNGTRTSLRPVWRRYGISVRPMLGDIGHSTALFLIDRDGYERAGYLLPFVSVDLAHDLRQLAAA